MTPLIYLDHAATSFPKAPPVAEAMTRFLSEAAGNPGRGGHRLTVAASRAIEAAREQVAELLAADPERTLLGSGATFWLNTVIHSLLKPGGRVVVSGLEHNAVMRPLRHLEASAGVEVVVVAGGEESGVPSASEVAAATAAADTSVVILCHASNVSGAVAPVAEIAAAVAPVPVVVDGAQTAGSMPVRFGDLGVAAFVCSGHKGLLGPPGTGVLLLAPQTELAPLVHGGTGSHSEHELMPGFLPDALEAGTPNGVGIVGLGAACAWIAEHGVEAIQHHGSILAKELTTALRRLPGVKLLGYDDHAARIAVLSFTVEGVDNGALAAWLDRERGIAVRAGLHCSPAAHRRLGSYPDGSVRVAIGPFTTAGELEQLVDAIAKYPAR